MSIKKRLSRHYNFLIYFDFFKKREAISVDLLFFIIKIRLI